MYLYFQYFQCICFIPKIPIHQTNTDTHNPIGNCFSVPKISVHLTWPFALIPKILSIEKFLKLEYQRLSESFTAGKKTTKYLLRCNVHLYINSRVTQHSAMLATGLHNYAWPAAILRYHSIRWSHILQQSLPLVRKTGKEDWLLDAMWETLHDTFPSSAASCCTIRMWCTRLGE